MNIRLKRQGFTLAEILTVVFVSSLLLVMLATLFSTGLHHVSRSSGRIEVVRNGRQALDNIQRYLASAMPPINVRDTNDITLPPPRAIFSPDSDEIHDPPLVIVPWQSRIQFFSQVDLLGNTPTLTAREITMTPPNLTYEIASVPGAAEGQDIVVRELTRPTPWDDAVLPLNANVAVRPRVIGKRLGVPVSGSYENGLLVRRLTGGSLLVNVNVWAGLTSDDYNANTVINEEAGGGPPRIIVMSTIFQPPYFNLD